MAADAIKWLLPNRPVPIRIWRGPFRGARVVMNPRHSLRKMFGLYEHELNRWLERALGRVRHVVDVGANDGYFTFGCAAAFRRLHKPGKIIAIEYQDDQIAKLRQSIEAQADPTITYEIVQAYAGRENGPGLVTLDSLSFSDGQTSALVKIDVEGAEIDVIEGGLKWIHPSNCFVIEVHDERFLGRLKSLFAERGHRLVQIDQRPLPWLGREMRDENNWWLVSELGGESV